MESDKNQLNTQKNEVNENTKKEETDFTDRLNVPYEEKKKGDEKLKEKNFDEALKHYSKVLLATKILVEDNSIQATEKYILEVNLPVYQNMSYIYLKKKDWENTLKYSKRVLDFDGENIKARYRYCFALINLGELVEVKKEIEYLKIRLSGTNEYDLIEAEYNKMLNKSKKDRYHFYKKIFKAEVVEAEEKENKFSYKNYIFDLIGKSLFFPFYLTKKIFSHFDFCKRREQKTKHF